MKKNFAVRVSLSIILFSSLAGCFGKHLAEEQNTIKISSSSADFRLISKTEQLNKQQKTIVNKFAPLIFQETNSRAKPEHWDFITSFDFDGDLIGSNNEKSLKSDKHQLPATVYYSFLETKSHYFIVYSLFHPLDWDTVPSFIPYTWHENDMENIQIVVSKAEEKVVLLSTQAHLDTEVSTVSYSGIDSGSKMIDHNDITFLNDDLSPGGTHAALFVEWGGHGIYNALKQKEHFNKLANSELKEGFTFIPAVNNIPDNYRSGKKRFRYQLVSTYDTFWTNYRNKQNIGNGKLLDGSFNYSEDKVSYQKLPRHFDSGRLSGPFKYDSGILPFAFSYSLRDKDLGSIFFNPAKKYVNTLKVSGDWSLDYIYNPYIEMAKPSAVISEK